MDITIQEINNDVTLIGLVGSLDTNTLNALRSRINTLLEQDRRRLIVDCTSLSFVSSAGVGALVMLHRRVNEMDATIRFAGTNGPVLEVMQLMNLGSVLNLSPDIDHARRALAQTQQDSSR